MYELAEAGIDVLCTNREGMNALHIAAKFNNFYITKMLIESDYPMELQCRNGMTAFHIAAFLGHSNIIEIFLYYAHQKGKKHFKKIMNQINP